MREGAGSPRFAATKEFFSQVGAAHGWVLLASAVAVPVLSGWYVASVLPVSLWGSVAALGAFGAIVALVAFSAGVVWAEMHDCAVGCARETGAESFNDQQ